MKAKRWIAALLAGALMLCGLPAYAAPTWTVPKQAQKLRYTFGERGFIEQDEQKIQQVLKTLQQVQGFARKGFTLVEWGGTDLTGFDVKIG